MMPIRPELLDELLKDCQNPQDWLGEGGILKQLTKAVVERALDAEMDMHLQATKQSAAGKPDRRSGHSQKTFKGEFGQVSIEVPRNRQGDSSRRWSRNDSPGLMASMRRSWRSMREE